MNYYIIAGEASGDLHGSNLIKEIRAKDKNATIRAWGGELMSEAGCQLVKHYKETSFMGFVEVLMNIRTIKTLLDYCKKDLQAFRPDVLVLIDYPGFNLRMASFAHQQGIKVFYYISPQVWAWKKNRVKTIKKVVDAMCVILPFEKEFYARHNYQVDFVGHPLLDAIANFENNTKTVCEELDKIEKPILAILPGSRKQEIKKMLPAMYQAAARIDKHQIVIAGLSSHSKSFYEKLLNQQVTIIMDQTYTLLSRAKLAVVTSGTATLEAALFNVPEVVCYKANAISYLLAKLFVGKNIEYISLVNLISKRETVKELIQSEMNERKIYEELSKLLEPAQKALMQEKYQELRKTLGGAGASERVAQALLKMINKKNS